MLTHFKSKYFTWLKQRLNIADQNIASLQFAASYIKIIIIANTAIGQELTDVHYIELPSDLKNYAWLNDKEYLASYIKANINYNSFKGAKAVATIDPEKIYLKELNMPMLNSAELEQAVRWDALQHLPYAENEYTYGYLSERWENNIGEGLKVSLIATEKNISQAIQYVCSQLGLELKQLTTNALAMSELVHTSYEHWAILDIGIDRSQIYFFTKHRPTYQTTISLGRVDFANVVSSALNLSPAETNCLLDDNYALNKSSIKSQPAVEPLKTICDKLSIQISLKIEDYLLNQHCPHIEAFFMTGTMPMLNIQLSKHISNQLNIHTELINPFEMFLIADKLHINSCDLSFAPALGAALSLSHNHLFSLVPTDNIATSRVSKYYKLILSLSVCLVIALSSYELAWLAIYKNEYHNLSNQHGNLIIWRKRHELITKLEHDIQRRESLLEQLEEQRTSWPQILLAFGYNTPDGVAITNISRVKDSDEYILRGKAENIEVVSKFIIALQKTAIFNKISLQHISESSSLSNTGEFLINLKGMGKGYAKPTHTNTQLP